MSARNHHAPITPALTAEDLESPFALEELFREEDGAGWDAHEAALIMESPFHAGLEHGEASAYESGEDDAAVDVLDLIGTEEEVERFEPAPASAFETGIEVPGELAVDGELFEGPSVPFLDEYQLYLEELVDEEVFDGETSSAQQEWQAVPSIHRHFQGDSPRAKFASYLELRPLYQQATGAGNPARWIADTIVSLSFFGRRTPGHQDLRGPLAAATDTLQRQGHTPRIDRFWGFVPRKMRTRNRLSNHALGRAVDINHPTNPHIFNRDEILVIREATGVDLGQPQPHDAMRRASREFQQTFNARWLQDQPAAVRQAAARRRARLDRYARTGFLDLEQPLIDALIGAGFTWGGDWRTEKDFMHFDLPASRRAAPSAPSAPSSQPGTTAPSPPPTRDQVRFAQRVLNRIQGENLKVDGLHGSLTGAALERFRGRNDLGAGGALDPRTLLALAQRALEELRRQSLFGQIGTLDTATREALSAFRSERVLGTDPKLDAPTLTAIADALER
jgi:hypothetical protein